MFGELMRWNPSQELSRCPVISTIYSVGSSGALKLLWAAGCLGLKHTAMTMSTLSDSISRVLIRRMSKWTRKGMFCPFPENERQSKRRRIIRKHPTTGKFQRTVTAAGCRSGQDCGPLNMDLEIRVPLPAQLAGRKIPIEIEQKENKKLENKAA